MDEMPEYLARVRGGRPPSPELVAEMRGNYEAIGGRSPLTGITIAQAEALASALGGIVPVVVGMRNWHPYISDALATLSAAGVTRTIGIPMAPQFSTAWNALGVIAFQMGEEDRAEFLFRKALAADPAAFEPLVNLGGALLKKKDAASALPFNQRAVQDRPEDALANAQLGMNYFKLDQFDQAEQYLLAAKRLDPAQFYQPQLFLADIYVRRGNRRAAIRELENVLALRPDGPLSDSLRHNLAQLSAAR